MNDILLDMASTIKVLVSRKKKRYKEDGFNLDLTYILDNIIAMGYPAAKLEGVYRNHIDDVYKFLEAKHKDHYKIYNLCSERSYDVKKFHDRVSVFPFDDHNPPKLEMIPIFCRDVKEWLHQDPLNVAVVHCKAGKGRTGLMICCYLLHQQFCQSANDALNFYGDKRTHNTKGVTIPSQRRYVNYYDRLLKSDVEYSSRPLVLHELVLDPIPGFSAGCLPELTVLTNQSQDPIIPDLIPMKKNGVLHLTLSKPLTVDGDVRLTLKNKPNVRLMKEKMFHFWFNTFFISDQAPTVLPPQDEVKVKTNHVFDNSASLNKASGLVFSRLGASLLQRPERASSLNSVYSDCNTSDSPKFTLTLTKQELDKVYKDNHHRIFPSDFKVTLFFSQPALPHPPNGVGSLPNMVGLNRSDLMIPSMLNPVQSAPIFVSSTANDSKRSKEALPNYKVTSSSKADTSQRHGILGPVCLRRPHFDAYQTEGFYHNGGVKPDDLCDLTSDSSDGSEGSFEVIDESSDTDTCRNDPPAMPTAINRNGKEDLDEEQDCLYV